MIQPITLINSSSVTYTKAHHGNLF